VDEVLADLEADILPRRIRGRTLEQELRIGTADLELERTRWIEHGLRAAERLEEGVPRIDVLPDPHPGDL
jgi:hypothetical protein